MYIKLTTTYSSVLHGSQKLNMREKSKFFKMFLLYFKETHI